jgi:lysophospholipid acyltransferase (LPLAT)-like uncharacterized protein
MMRTRILPLLAAVFVRTLFATLRVRTVGRERIDSAPQYVLTFWHAHLLMMLHSTFRRPITVLSSQSKDGDISANVFRYYGVNCIRGSSTRGGTAALRGLIRAARDGSNIVFTPDGPKGPPRVAKEGVIVAARSTGLPIIPVAFAAKKKSSSVRGTGWSYRTPSAARSSSTANRSKCRVTQRTSRTGAFEWSRRSMRLRTEQRVNSKAFGKERIR